MGIAVVRPGALYGPRDNFDLASSHVVPSLIRRALEGESPFQVWGSGEDIRDFLHVGDFARGCLLALEHKEGQSEEVAAWHRADESGRESHFRDAGNAGDARARR
jgi:nucleoside-diphosphate-sugar epimerase